jgi:hypothetical protein
LYFLIDGPLAIIKNFLPLCLLIKAIFSKTKASLDGNNLICSTILFTTSFAFSSEGI